MANNLPVQVDAKMLVVKPDATLTNTATNVSVADDGAGALRFGKLNPADKEGARFSGSVTTPEEFLIGVAEAEKGGWNFVQIITPQRFDIVDQSGNSRSMEGNGQVLLDNSFPYLPDPPPIPAVWTNTTAAVAKKVADAPGGDLDATLTMVRFGTANGAIPEKFTMYILYLPPGIQSRFVPLKSIAWEWKGQATKGNNGVWTVSNTGFSVSNPTDEIVHPQWTGNVKTLDTMIPTP